MDRDCPTTVSLIKVALAEDYGIIRKTIVQHLSSQKNISLSCATENGQELLDCIASEGEIPDVILMDVLMPVLDGFETTHRINQLYPQTKILYLTSQLSSDFFDDVLSYGGHGYITKDTDFELMQQAIEQVHERGFYFNEEVDPEILIRFLNEGKIKPVFLEKESLTRTEFEFVKQWAQELSDHRVAKQLGIPLLEITKYRERIMKKIGVVNAVGFQVFALYLMKK